MSERERIGLTGHQGLTDNTETLVREAMHELLGSSVCPTGVTSLAEGADQIFAEVILEKGGHLEVVVPADDYEMTFDLRSLTNYRLLISSASLVVELGHKVSNERAYWDAGKWIVNHTDRLIAVWNGEAARGLGGTADVVNYARERGKTVEVVWPAGAQRE